MSAALLQDRMPVCLKMPEGVGGWLDHIRADEN